MTPVERAVVAVRQAVEVELARELSARESPRLTLEDQDWVYELVGRAVLDSNRRETHPLDHDEWAEVWRRVFGAVTPLGPLAEHLADPAVEEVRINGTGACFVVRGGRREAVAPPFETEQALVDLVHWYTDGAGTARLDRASPTVTVTLPDGSRLHAALSPPARPMSVTIRRHPPARFASLADVAAEGFMPARLIPFLEAAVRARLNILVAGGTGTGKTTFMRLLCRVIPAEERVVTIEDQAELHLWRELADCVSLEARAANADGRGAISIQMLVNEALRMSPDRIVIGEVRGAEALDLLDAMNTGHPGSICTVHSDSPRDTLPRVARLALRSPHAPRPETVAAEIARTVDLVVHLEARTEAERRVRRLASVGYVTGIEAGQPVVDELVRWTGGDGWEQVGSVASLPDRARAKLARIEAEVGALLGGLDD